MPELQHSEVVALLPDSPPPWRKFLFSVGGQAVLIAALLVGQMFWRPYVFDSSRRSYQVVELVEPRPYVNPAPERVPIPPPPKVTISVPVLKVAPDVKPQPRIVESPIPATPSIPAKPVALPAARPVLPKPVVTTNVFSASSAKPTLDRAAKNVQTGGFGDPNGVSARSDKNIPVNIARSGGFDLPPGPGVGNGSGVSKGEKGVVASAGFGQATDPARTGSSGSPAAVQESGFGAATAAKTLSKDTSSAAQSVIPAEILSKPVPSYTEEARKLRIQGEVLLDVILEASGGIRILRVVRGLGHGLDESAVQAAGQIRFKPETRDGRPSDSRVVLHITFQLA